MNTKWKLVPVEPTKEMLFDGLSADTRWFDGHRRQQADPHTDLENRFKAMLNAAPPAPQADIDRLSNFIRCIDGNNSMGAGALAEKIIEWMTTRQAPQAEQPLCQCKDRAASICPGEWEPGCDLGNNDKYAQASQRELDKEVDATLGINIRAEQSGQEPVATVVKDDDIFARGFIDKNLAYGTKLYTSPPNHLALLRQALDALDWMPTSEATKKVWDRQTPARESIRKELGGVE